MMTPEEIAGSYRRAVNQSAQINILAELNTCSREEIIKTLKEQGFKIKTTKRGRKKAAETPETLGTTEKTSTEENTAESITAAVAAGTADMIGKDIKENGNEPAENVHVAAPEDKGIETSESENAAASESENAAVPNIVKIAVRKEMIVVQKNIDSTEDQIKAVKTTMKELEKSLEKHMQNLKTLKQYLE